MTQGARTGMRPFWRRPLSWCVKWIRREIDVRATAQLEELRRVEAQLTRHIEVRAMVSVQEATSPYVAERAALRKTLEMRAQLAAEEAKGYADHGLGALSRSLGAANRVVADATKRINIVENALSRNADAVAAAWQENAQRMDAMEERIALRLDLVPDILNARLRPLDAVQAEFVTRCENIERELGRIVSDYNAQLRNAEHRIEFIRSETMYEMQASSYRASGQRSPSRTVARIMDPIKVDAMRATGLRLNVGCGHIQLDGYLNVDGRELPGVDVVADATDIPFDENEVAEIRSAHLVEHFTSHILERVLLPHWSALLQSGGVLTTIAPDGAAMLQAVNDGEMEFEDFREVLFGGQDYDGDFHYNLITPKTFSEALKRAGFRNITEEYIGKRNGKCFEFKISAQKA